MVGRWDEVIRARPRFTVEVRDAVALTFDDGPDPDFTPQVLDQLRATKAVATFFVVGDRVAAHPELVRRIVEAGHAVGTHSWSHPEAATTPVRQLAADYRRGRATAEAAVGGSIRLFRPPKGHIDRRGVLAMAMSRLAPWLWSCDTEDWKAAATVDSIVAAVASIEGGAVVLCHDSLHDNPDARDRQATVDAIAPLVDHVRTRGLRLVTLPA